MVFNLAQKVRVTCGVEQVGVRCWLERSNVGSS